MKGFKADLAPLRTLLDTAASGLADVTHRRMFGCDALFADGRIFALVWKEGRIGVRLPDRALLEKVMAMGNAAPWRAGDREMAHWVLLPTAFHDETQKLARWVKKAHQLALAGDGEAEPDEVGRAPKKPAQARPWTQAVRGVALPPPAGARVPSTPGAVPRTGVSHRPRPLAASSKRPSVTASTERPLTTAADRRRRTTGDPAPGAPSSPREVHSRGKKSTH